VVVGAGPCGLRAAIELRMLGATVSVVEMRSKFSRLNQLHIWSWVGEDLKGLGAGVLSPPPNAFVADHALLHVGIAELQTHLLKIALLLGVEIFLGTRFISYRWEAKGWEVLLEPNPQVEADISPRAPRTMKNVAVIVAANGFGSEIYKQADMNFKEVKTSTAIGLTCNISVAEGDSRKPLHSFAKAYQYFLPMFGRAKDEIGVDLENIAYTKPYDGALSHYFVCTPKLHSLAELEVIRDPNLENPLTSSNIDKEKLSELAKRIADFRWIDGEKSVLAQLQEESGEFPGWADSCPRLFDFSKTRQSVEGIKFVQPPSGPSDDDALVLVLVGDALLEPFWPQGLGAVRGFLGALDAAYAIMKWCTRECGAEAAEDVFRSCFRELQTLAAATQDNVFCTRDYKTYRLAPDTRYRHVAPCR